MKKRRSTDRNVARRFIRWSPILALGLVGVFPPVWSAYREAERHQFEDELNATKIDFVLRAEDSEAIFEELIDTIKAANPDLNDMKYAYHPDDIIHGLGWAPVTKNDYPATKLAGIPATEAFRYVSRLHLHTLYFEIGSNRTVHFYGIPQQGYHSRDPIERSWNKTEDLFWSFFARIRKAIQ